MRIWRLDTLKDVRRSPALLGPPPPGEMRQ
jgi:hypothetical protein